MSDFVSQLLRSPDTVLESGHVHSVNGNGSFSVMVNGKIVSAQSAISSEIRTGMRVIINSTASGFYISGAVSKTNERERKEVVING